MSGRRILAILGALAVVGLVVLVLRRGGSGSPPPPAEAPTPRSAEARRGPAAEAESASRRAEAQRARDALREQIVAALRRRDAGPPPVARSAQAAAPRPKEAPPEDEPLPSGSYEPSYIRDHFRADMFPLLKQCYEGALARRPALGGRLVLKFAIVGDPTVGGIVEDAAFADESDLKDEEMETCVRESLMTLTFDKPPSGGGKVTVTYPVVFSPGDPPPETAAASVHDGGAGRAP
jgi:hypothetical protein